MSECRCHNPPFDYRGFVSTPIGIDMTNGRYGEVSSKKCVLCGTKWLHYFVEYEAFTASSRWFQALISDEALATLTPEQAVPFLEQQPWYFLGGSYFQSRGQRSTGKVRADL
jgi:hypothetical protein